MESRTRPLTILLAEDAAVNQTLVVRLLEKRGHAVLVASNGREAVATFQQQPVDLILMDLQMPEMDGFEATEAIRALHVPGRRATPIVALSVHNSRADRERCLLAGMNACIAKPIDIQQLAELVETLALRAPHSPPQPIEQAPQGPLDFRSAIARLDGDVGLFRELGRFLENDSPALLERLQTAVAANNAGEVSMAAHTLKGLLGNFNAHRAVALAGQLETMGQQQALAGGAALIDPLRDEIESVQRALSQFWQRQQAPPAMEQGVPTQQLKS